MLLIFLTIVLQSFCAIGAWELSYPNAEGCTSAGLKSATMLIDHCVSLNGYSFNYDCTDSATRRNITTQVYSNLDCAGTPIHVEHIAETRSCTKNPDESSTFVKWLCVDEFKVGFSNIELNIPIHTNESDIGSTTNPIIAKTFALTGKCMKGTMSRYHTTVTCDDKTKEGEIKFYETGLCILPVHHLKMTPGDIVNIGQLMKETIYVKYNGCTNM